MLCVQLHSLTKRYKDVTAAHHGQQWLRIAHRVPFSTNPGFFGNSPTFIATSCFNVTWKLNSSTNTHERVGTLTAQPTVCP
jgi:hypothetical protein